MCDDTWAIESHHSTHLIYICSSGLCKYESGMCAISGIVLLGKSSFAVWHEKQALSTCIVLPLIYICIHLS